MVLDVSGFRQPFIPLRYLRAKRNGTVYNRPSRTSDVLQDEPKLLDADDHQFFDSQSGNVGWSSFWIPGRSGVLSQSGPWWPETPRGREREESNTRENAGRQASLWVCLRNWLP